MKYSTRIKTKHTQIDESYTARAYKQYTVPDQQTAQKDFKAKAKNLILDYNAFHMGYDEDLIVALGNTNPKATKTTNPAAIQMFGKADLDDMFNDDGSWRNRGSYKYIKQMEPYCKYYTQMLDVLKATKLCWGMVYGSDPNKIAQQTLPVGNGTAASGSAASATSTNSNPAASSGIAGSPLEVKKRKMVQNISKAQKIWSTKTKKHIDKNTTPDDFNVNTRFYITYMLKYCLEEGCTTGPRISITVSANKAYAIKINSMFIDLRDMIIHKKYDKVDEIETILDEFNRMSFASTIKRSGPKIDETMVMYNGVDFVSALAVLCKEIGWDMKDYDWTVFREDGLFLRGLLQVGVLGDY